MSGTEAKTVKTEFRCDVCNKSVNSKLILDEHLQGIKHERMLRTRAVVDELKTSGQFPVKPPGLEGFQCKPCGVQLNSHIQLASHLSGAKHKQKVQGGPPQRVTRPWSVWPVRNQPHQATPQAKQPNQESSAAAAAHQADSKTEGPSPAGQVMPPAAPQKLDASAAPKQEDASATPEKVDASAMPEKGGASAMPEKGGASATSERGDASATSERGDASATSERGDASATPEKGDGSATSLTLHCDVCDVTTNSPNQYQQHMESPKHAAVVIGKRKVNPGWPNGAWGRGRGVCPEASALAPGRRGSKSPRSTDWSPSRGRGGDVAGAGAWSYGRGLPRGSLFRPGYARAAAAMPQVPQYGYF